MKFSIKHSIHYKYSQPVKLQPQVMYMHPRQSYGQYVLHYQLDINPNPIFTSRNYDLGGNIQQIAFFEGLTQNLDVNCSFEIVTPVSNGFDFLYFPLLSDTFPVDYGKDTQIAEVYKNSVDFSAVEHILNQINSQAGASISQFLRILNQYIHNNFKYLQRFQGDAQSPEDTIDLKSGTCRDFAVLFVEVCRAAGLAARFVSGYYYQSNFNNHDLHAWAEVLLPGGGWRGFDPTYNISVGENHITLATSALSGNIYPVNGFYNGQASHQMDFSIKVEAIL